MGAQNVTWAMTGDTCRHRAERPEVWEGREVLSRAHGLGDVSKERG